MAFEARWRGQCSECEEWFSSGDYIDRSSAGYRHAGLCPIHQPKRTGSICEKCFTEKSISGACECDE